MILGILSHIKLSDISPIFLWAGTTAYGFWTYIRGERVKRDEINRQKALDERQVKLDHKAADKEDISDDAARADRWKADAELWEIRAKWFMAELDKKQKIIDERSANWTSMNTNYAEVAERERTLYELAATHGKAMRLIDSDKKETQHDDTTQEK